MESVVEPASYLNGKQIKIDDSILFNWGTNEFHWRTPSKVEWQKQRTPLHSHEKWVNIFKHSDSLQQWSGIVNFKNIYLQEGSLATASANAGIREKYPFLHHGQLNHLQC